MTKQKDCMENEKLTERESLELITRMIERARKTEIGRLNFVTLYGALGLVMTIAMWTLPEAGLYPLWIAVPVVSYGVPYVYHKMWKKPMTVTGRIVKSGWFYFAWLSLLSAIFGTFDKPGQLIPLMILPLCCALFMFSGLFKNKDVLVCAFWGTVWSVMSFVENEAVRSSRMTCFCLFFAVSIISGLSIDKDMK